MSDTTTTVAQAASKAGEKAIKAVAAATETLPTVVETTEIALEVPAKVVLNQKLVVLVAGAVGAGLAVGGLFGYRKLQEYRTSKKVVVPDDASSLEDIDTK